MNINNFFLHTDPIINLVNPSIIQNITLGIITLFAALVLGILIQDLRLINSKKDAVPYTERYYLIESVLQYRKVFWATFFGLFPVLFLGLNNILDVVIVILAFISWFLFTCILANTIAYLKGEMVGSEDSTHYLGRPYGDKKKYWREVFSLRNLFDSKNFKWETEREILKKFKSDFEEELTLENQMEGYLTLTSLVRILLSNLKNRDVYSVGEVLLPFLLDTYLELDVVLDTSSLEESDKIINNRKSALRRSIKKLIEELFELNFKDQYSITFSLYNDYLISLDERAPKDNFLEYRNYIVKNNLLFQSLCRTLEKEGSINWDFFPEILQLTDGKLRYVFLNEARSYIRHYFPNSYVYLMSKLISDGGFDMMKLEDIDIYIDKYLENFKKSD